MNAATRYRSRDLAAISERSRSVGGADPSGFLPLDEAAYRVLQAIGARPLPPHELMQALWGAANGAEPLAPSDVCSALVRLIDLGLLEEAAVEPATSVAPVSLHYGRTPLGYAVIQAEAGRRRRRSGWSQLAEVFPGGHSRTA